MIRSILCFVLLLTLACGAQEATPAPQEASPTPAPQGSTPAPRETPGEHPAHAELRLLRQHMEDAMNARDIDSILEGVAENVVFSTMNGDVVHGKQNIRAYFEKMMTGPDARVKEVETQFEVDELTILYPKDSEEPRFGIAWGHSEDSYTLADDTTFQVQPRWSAALVRDEQGWKIANFHYSVNMFDNPVVGKMKGTIAMVATVAVVLGLIIGFFVGRRRP